MVAINATLKSALKAVGYHTVEVRITNEIAAEATDVPLPENSDLAREIEYKMSHANALCRRLGSADALVVFAIKAIRRFRAERDSQDPKGTKGSSTSFGTEAAEPQELVVPKTAYVIRQLKRPEEVALLRKIYGRQFILLSAYGSVESRRKILSKTLKREMPINTTDVDILSTVDALIVRDENEKAVAYGQNLRETFPLADVFIDGINKRQMADMIRRFVDAFFGRTDIAPSKSEYGMYAAKSASLRSSDLSRQIGAAIFTSDGEVITQGCNEVPKAFGGTYWDGEEPDYRDVKLGQDPNDVIKREVVRDLLERLDRGGFLSSAAKEVGSSAKLLDALVSTPKHTDPEGYGVLADAAVMELTEYGRVVHAEMCALCDAARLGRSVRGGILYCTTFPCHNCTKHILAAGIWKVVFIEPYPKSRAKELHENEIELERPSEARVSFLPFLGISPARYRDIFEKGRRKKQGVALEWLRDQPQPMLDSPAPTYIDLEAFEIARFSGGVQVKR